MKTINKVSQALLLFFATLPLLYGLCDDGGGGPTTPDAGLYHTYQEITTELQQLTAANSTISLVTSIGRSLEGRELWALKISARVTEEEGEPVMLLMGAHHAREWISVEVPFLIAKHMLSRYGSDTLITRLVDHSEVWVIPMLNPDGHQHSVSTDRLWRKNRRNNGDGSYGVDLNRNYGYQWGGSGSSGDPFSEIYRGPTSFSEPETQAARDFINQIRPDALISYHSYSQLILFPWGYTSNKAPDEALLYSLAVAMADQIRSVNGKNYTPQQAAALYLASGDTVDWLYSVFGVPAFTIELRPQSGYPGFELPESEIAPTFQENLPAMLHLLDWVVQQR